MSKDTKNVLLTMLLIVTFLTALFTITHFSQKNDWNNERFTAVCEDRGGKVYEMYETVCVKQIGPGSLLVVLTKSDWLEKRNG